MWLLFFALAFVPALVTILSVAFSMEEIVQHGKSVKQNNLVVNWVNPQVKERVAFVILKVLGAVHGSLNNYDVV